MGTTPSSRCAGALLAALCIASCRAPGDAAPVIPSTPLSGGESVRVEGTYVHDGSGILFPETAAPVADAKWKNIQKTAECRDGP